MQTVLKTKVKVNHCALSECRWHGDCYLSVCAAAAGSGCIIEAVTFGFYKKREMFLVFFAGRMIRQPRRPQIVSRWVSGPPTEDHCLTT